MFSPKIRAIASLALLQCVVCESLEERMYNKLGNGNPCWRTLNNNAGEGTVGCQAKEDPEYGVLFMVDTEDSKTQYKANEKDVNYAAVIKQNNFTSQLLSELAGLSATKLLYVLGDEASGRPASYSPALKSPNGVKGLYHNDPTKQLEWNPNGGQENFKNSFNFPMVLFNKADDINIIKTLASNNVQGNSAMKNFPLQSAQTDFFMNGAGNAEICLRRYFCDPVSNNNVYGFWKKVVNSNDKFIVAAAALDSTSLFKGNSPGASTVMAVAALLGAAQILKTIPEADRAGASNILFTLFNGEAYDYIGSSRFVIDMNDGNFKPKDGVTFNVNNIEGILELSPLSSRGSLYVHSHPVAESQTATTNLITQVTTAAGGTSLTVQSASQAHVLPPSSTQMFLRWGKRSIPSIVIADHDKTYTNLFYQSFLDDYVNVDVNNPTTKTYLCNVAHMYARALFTSAGGSATVASALTVADDICQNTIDFVKSSTVGMNTTYMQNLFSDSPCDMNDKSSVCNNNVSLQNYVGVTKNNVVNKYSLATAALYQLTKTFGEIQQPATEKDKCTSSVTDSATGTRLLFVANQCYNHSITIKTAFSPGINGHDIVNTSFSLWTESRWSEGGHRTFLTTSSSDDYIVLGIGLIMFIVSFMAMGFILKGAKKFKID